MVPSAAITARRGEIVVVKGQEGMQRCIIHEVIERIIIKSSMHAAPNVGVMPAD